MLGLTVIPLPQDNWDPYVHGYPDETRSFVPEVIELVPVVAKPLASSSKRSGGNPVASAVMVKAEKKWPLSVDPEVSLSFLFFLNRFLTPVSLFHRRCLPRKLVLVSVPTLRHKEVQFRLAKRVLKVPSFPFSSHKPVLMLFPLFPSDEDLEEADSDVSLVSVKVGTPSSHQRVLKVPKSIKEAKPVKGVKSAKSSKAAKEPSEDGAPDKTNPTELNKVQKAQKAGYVSSFFCDGKQYVLVDRIGRPVSTFLFCFPFVY